MPCFARSGVSWPTGSSTDQCVFVVDSRRMMADLKTHSINLNTSKCSQLKPWLERFVNWQEPFSKKSFSHFDCLAVFPLNYLRVSSVVESHERESARSSSSSLRWKIDISNLSIFFKERLQVLQITIVNNIVSRNNPFYTSPWAL